jgi:hypothetical protein
MAADDPGRVVNLYPPSQSLDEIEREIAAAEARVKQLKVRRKKISKQARRGRPSKPAEAYWRLRLRWSVFQRDNRDLPMEARALRFLRSHRSWIDELGLVIGRGRNGGNEAAYRQLLNAVLHGKREIKKQRMARRRETAALFDYARAVALGVHDTGPFLITRTGGIQN